MKNFTGTILTIALVLTASLSVCALAGVYTPNKFFYLPDYGATGTTEWTTTNNAMTVTDARLGKEVWVGDPKYGTTLQTAVTGIGTAEKTLHLAPGTYSITSNYSIPLNITLKPERGAIFTIANGVALTINGSLEASLYQIFSCTGTGKVIFGTRVKEVYPEWWGAKGDGSTDCTTATNGAITTAAFASGSRAKGLPVKFGAGTYMISSRLYYSAILEGVSPEATIIKATSTFTDPMMVDFHPPVFKPCLAIKGIRFDGNNVSGLSIFGAFASGGDGNSQSRIERVIFSNAAYAVNFGNVIAGPGAATGSIFSQCVFYGCDVTLNLGINQDDILFQGCRFDLTANTDKYAPPINHAGGNLKIINSYVYFGNLYNLSGLHVVINEIGHTTSFENMTFESAPSSNLTHIFYFGAVTVNYEIRNLYFNISGAASLVAVLRVNVGAWSFDRRPIIKASNFYSKQGIKTKLADVFVNSAASTDFLTLSVNGIGQMISDPIFQWAPGSVVPSRDTVYINGKDRGLEYNHSFNQGIGNSTPQTQQVYGNYKGLVCDQTGQLVMGPSPQTCNYSLPGPGVWLLSVTVKVGGGNDNMANGTWMVYFYHEGNDTLVSEQLGTTNCSAGGSIELSLGNPDTAGVVPAACTFNGASQGIVFYFKARQLTNFDRGD